MKKVKKPGKTNNMERTPFEIITGKLLQHLIDSFPDSMIDRIDVLRDALLIQFKALSFAKCSPEKLEKYGKELIDNTCNELLTYITNLHEELLEMWKEDKEYREEKGEKNGRVYN